MKLYYTTFLLDIHIPVNGVQEIEKNPIHIPTARTPTMIIMTYA